MLIVIETRIFTDSSVFRIKNNLCFPSIMWWADYPKFYLLFCTTVFCDRLQLSPLILKLINNLPCLTMEKCSFNFCDTSTLEFGINMPYCILKCLMAETKSMLFNYSFLHKNENYTHKMALALLIYVESHSHLRYIRSNGHAFPPISLLNWGFIM